MDVKEAVGNLESVKKDRFKAKLIDGFDWLDTCELAIEALEKLIPQTVESVGGIVDLCPLCQTDVKGKYCYNCGQKLNWKTTS